MSQSSRSSGNFCQALTTTRCICAREPAQDRCPYRTRFPQEPELNWAQAKPSWRSSAYLRPVVVGYSSLVSALTSSTTGQLRRFLAPGSGASLGEHQTVRRGRSVRSTGPSLLVECPHAAMGEPPVRRSRGDACKVPSAVDRVFRFGPVPGVAGLAVRSSQPGGRAAERRAHTNLTAAFQIDGDVVTITDAVDSAALDLRQFKSTSLRLDRSSSRRCFQSIAAEVFPLTR